MSVTFGLEEADALAEEVQDDGGGDDAGEGAADAEALGSAKADTLLSQTR